MVRRAFVITLFMVGALAWASAPALGGGGAGAAATQRADAAGTLTFSPRLDVVRFGRTITVLGSLTAGGAPVAGVTVVVHRLGETTGSDAITDAQGRFETTIRPRTNADWAASAGELQSDAVLIRVAPKITLELSHKKTAAGPTEWFGGSVAPNHAGRTMRVQMATASGWRTVASGKLNARSRYRIAWALPQRSATYRLRVVLPAHDDHARGSSRPATLQVVVTRG